MAESFLRCDSFSQQCFRINWILLSFAISAVVSTSSLNGTLAPKITVPPRDETVLRGSTINMTCRVSGVPKPEVNWLGGLVELTGNRYRIFEDGNFQISEVNLLDQGKYTCFAINSEGTAMASAILTVMGDQQAMKLPGSDYKILDGKVLRYKEYRDFSTDQLDAKDPSLYEYDFDPEYLEKQLISGAFSIGATPKQYQKELKLLVGSITTNRRKSEEIRDLEQKYNISSLPDADPEGEGYSFPDTITPTRLILMFPQYFRFDMAELNRVSYNFITGHCLELDEVLPKIMKFPEFAGLIPTTVDSGLKVAERNNLIRVFLYWQFCNVAADKRTEESFRNIHLAVMKRIQASRLSNRQREDFLARKNILDCASEFIASCSFPERYLKPVKSSPHLLTNTTILFDDNLEF